MAKVFQEWLDELDIEAAKHDGPINIVEQTGPECWLDYYMGGYSPAEAWEEDCSCADVDETVTPQ